MSATETLSETGVPCPYGAFGEHSESEHAHFLTQLRVIMGALSVIVFGHGGDGTQVLSMIRAAGDDWRPHVSRGRALAGLGRREKALGEVQWLKASRVYREDAYYSPMIGANLAIILTNIGEHEAA